MKAPVNTRLADVDLEQVRRDHHERIVELQRSVKIPVVLTVQLEDGIKTPVPHQLGKLPTIVKFSVVRAKDSTVTLTTGRVVEIRDGTFGRDLFVTLQADGWGATIEIEVELY